MRKLVSSKRFKGAIHLRNIHNKKVKVYVSKKLWSCKRAKIDEGFVQFGRMRIYEGAWKSKGFEWFIRLGDVTFSTFEFVKSPNKHTYISIISKDNQ